MAGLDDLIAQIPVQDIASKIGADEGEVNNAIRTLVPALVGGLQQNVQADDIDSSKLESGAAEQGASGLLDGGVTSTRSTRSRATRSSPRSSAATTATPSPPRWPAAAQVGGGPDQEAAADPGADRAGLHRQAARHRKRPAPARPQAAGAVGRRRRPRRHPGQHPRRRRGGGGGGNNPLGSILGSVIGGGAGQQPIGDILGGLLGGKK